MHPDDIEELGELGFGFPMAGVVEVYRKALELQREQPVPSEKVRVRRDLEDLHKWQIGRADWLLGFAARAN